MAAEHWHPDPGFYYQKGGGPVLDMGPYYLSMLVNLMGPVCRVQAVTNSGQKERFLSAESPKKGTTIPVGTPTSVLSLLEFECGATVTFGASWDVFQHCNRPIEIHCTQGSISLPDPDFGNYRMAGVADLAAALMEDRRPRASGDLALHILDVMESILIAGESGEAQGVAPVNCQPQKLTDDDAQRMLAQ